jgi:bifunctional DNase/RNase
MGDEWTEVSIRGVVIDPMSGDPTVLLEDDAESAIIAVAGDPSVTGAIISELEGIEHDVSQTLLYRFFVRHGVSVTRVELSQDRAGRLGASLWYEYQSELHAMEVRPIDGLLIAVQTHAPVVAHEELIQRDATPAAPRVMDGQDLLILSRRAR